MAKSKRNKKKGADAPVRRFCAMPEAPERSFAPGTATGRMRLIILMADKWVNGTVLRYAFFKSPAKWAASEDRKEMVRRAFGQWKDLGIGLQFKETESLDEAEIRIGFQRGDGHWSYLGSQILDYGASERTMNLDRGDRGLDIDTAIHEIGHTLGFPHEHQNPKAGIVWDEEAVYKALGKSPNNWDRRTTYYNIIRKISPDDVQGSTWDSDSIMHYNFEPGLIKQPARYYRDGLNPAPGLSERDKSWVRTFYPPFGPQPPATLKPFESVRLHLEPGGQADFTITPQATRTYTMSTFGESDAVMVLFEEVDGELRYRTGDDDSGVDFNAKIQAKLFSGRRYVLRLRLYYQHSAGDLSVMLW